MISDCHDKWLRNITHIEKQYCSKSTIWRVYWYLSFGPDSVMSFQYYLGQTTLLLWVFIIAKIEPDGLWINSEGGYSFDQMFVVSLLSLLWSEHRTTWVLGLSLDFIIDPLAFHHSFLNPSWCSHRFLLLVRGPLGRRKWMAW